MNFKVRSLNTTKYITLHDCDCKRLYFKDSELVMEMEWMEISAEHPENPYDKAHQSGNGKIEFSDPVIIDFKIFPTSGDTQVPCNCEPSLEEIEILSFFENDTITNQYKYVRIDALSSDNDFISIEFLYKNSYIMWNELNGESWFEDEIWKPEITNEEITKMLSCNNTADEQQRGIELAAQINYLGCFFQPDIDGQSKSLWENCALILSGKTDEELTPWLLECYVWLQDMNWPGAAVIAERLSAYKDTEKLASEGEKALKIAQITNDSEWAYNIRHIGHKS